jgi:hypothetical protein
MAMLYRCFFLSAENRFCASVEINSDDDESALAQARVLFAAQSDYPAFELWEGGRYVHAHSATKPDDS